MTDTRFVIPADADPGAVAWPGYRPETWLELSMGYPIENFGSEWCIDHEIDGLGFVSVDIADPAPTEPEVIV